MAPCRSSRGGPVGLLIVALLAAVAALLGPGCTSSAQPGAADSAASSDPGDVKRMGESDDPDLVANNAPLDTGETPDTLEEGPGGPDDTGKHEPFDLLEDADDAIGTSGGSAQGTGGGQGGGASGVSGSSGFAPGSPVQSMRGWTLLGVGAINRGGEDEVIQLNATTAGVTAIRLRAQPGPLVVRAVQFHFADGSSRTSNVNRSVTPTGTEVPVPTSETGSELRRLTVHFRFQGTPRPMRLQVFGNHAEQQQDPD